MAWAKNGSTTLTGTSDIIDIDPIDDKKFDIILHHALYSGDSNSTFNLNSDTLINYARRSSYSGGADSTGISQTKFSYDDSSVHDSLFAVTYMVNISTEEKLMISNQATITTTGAGTAPARAEQVQKWTNTSDAITAIKHTQSSGGGNYLTDSNVSVLGSDAVSSWTLQDGLIFYETDTNKEYILSNNTWTEL